MSTKTVEKRSDAPLASKRSTTAKPPTPNNWIARPAVRAGLSVLIALHVAAVFIAPLTNPPAPPSAFNSWLQPWVEPYLDLAYLNHGYGFFSPNPGANFIIRYRIERLDGQVLEGVLPDLDDHWPRLCYHRHFMLTSQVNMFGGLPEAYLTHLQKTHAARRVELEYVEHAPATMEQVAGGMQLDDPQTYRLAGLASIDEGGQIEIRVIDPPPPAAIAAPPRRDREEVSVIAAPGRAGGVR